MKFIALIGRLFYAFLFLSASIGHFNNATVQYASSQGVPLPEFFVPFSGVILILGGLSILLGYKARIGAWLLVIFLIPTTILLHNFWAESNEMMASMQQIMFFKNIALLGAALLITYFGSGPLSIDKQQRID